METAPVDKIEVQMLAMKCQQVEDGGIYKLRQICTAPFSNNRSTHSRPVLDKMHGLSLTICKIICKLQTEEEKKKKSQTGRNGYP